MPFMFLLSNSSKEIHSTKPKSHRAPSQFIRNRKNLRLFPFLVFNSRQN